MLTATQATQQTTTTNKTYTSRPDYIFVLQTYDGRIVVGQANNAAKRIAYINSGFNPALPAMSIHSIIGVKEQNEERTYVGVVNKMIKRYGEHRVIAV